jgi:TolB-like protein/Tfp pilus assembly protein PilF
LARILASPAFKGSLRRRNFLSYIVEQTLAGAASRLKAFDIAVAVLGRDESFDPQSDPIVRLEARRLRRDLEHYYLTEGSDDPVRIAIPKGGYVPVFEACGPDPDSAPPADAAVRPRRRFVVVLLAISTLFVTVAAGAWWWLVQADDPAGGGQQRGPVVVVLPFETGDGSAMQAGLAAGLTNDLVAALRRFGQLRLFAPDRSVAAEAVPELVAGAGQPVGFVVRGMLQQDERQLHVTARLTDARTGEVVWSETFERRLGVSGLLEIQTDLAAQLAGRLAQPYGIVHQASVERFQQTSPASLFAYACVQEAYEFRRISTLQRHPSVRTCLEEAVRRDPGYADAWAMLAFVHQNALVLGLVPENEHAAMLARSVGEAEQAYRLAPEGILSLQALAAARFFSGDFGEAERLIREAVALNPNDPETLAQLAWRLLVRGRVEDGSRLMREAIERSVSAPTWYHLVAGYGAYLQGDHATALEDAAQARGAIANQDLALLAMTLGQLGRLDEAKPVLARLKAEAPRLAEDPVAAYRMFHVAPGILERFLDGLRKAGLEVATGTAQAVP